MKLLFYGSKPVQPCAACPLTPSVELAIFRSGKRKSCTNPTVPVYIQYIIQVYLPVYPSNEKVNFIEFDEIGVHLVRRYIQTT